MTLDFLSLAAAGPLARSPLADRSHQRAELEERDGWQVVVSYGDAEGESLALGSTVGWADRSHLAKLELSPPAELPATLTPGQAERRGAGWACPITARRALLVGDSGAVDGPALDLTSNLAAIAVAGPLAREAIARFCALDVRASALPVGGFRPGSIARTPGYLLRDGEDSFLLLFGAAYGIYLWEVVADAGARLGGRPVGVEALVPAAASREEAAADA
jgi:glycine cleavage system aminomethyltransferase T